MGSGSTLPYELRIGVTGHRDATGIAIDDAVRAVLKRIAGTLADPAVPLSWVVVSPLAQGADRMVARAAMERGARLDVITPFPLTEYRKDFKSEQDLREFDQLIEQARKHGGNIIEPHNATLSMVDRDEDYLRAGEEVVDACEVLIAIWDGRRASGKGGTEEIVRHAVDVGRLVLWIHAEIPQQTIVRIEKIIERPDGELDVLGRDFPTTAEMLSPGYAQQVVYCNDRSIDEQTIDAEVHRAAMRLEGHSTDARLDAAEWRVAIAPVLREQVRSDLLAQQYQRRHTANVKLTVCLAAAAVTVAAVQIMMFPERGHSWIIVFEVLFMAAVFSLWQYGRRAELHQHWLRNRYLAERLRAAIFTTLPRGGAQAEPPPLPFYGGPQHWMMRTAAAMSNDAVAKLQELSLEPLKAFIAAAWIEDQRRFHQNNAEKRTHAVHRAHRAGLVLFAATLVMAILHLFHVGDALAKDYWPIFRVANWFTVMALVLPVWAGANHALMGQLELERVAARSRGMAFALAHIRAHILRARTPQELRDRTKQAMDLIHDETHEWWVLLSFQDVRLHV